MTMDTTTRPLGWRWAPAWVLTFVALWPARGVAEAVLVLGALAGLAKLLASRFHGGERLLGGPAWALTSVLFAAYWLPEVLAAVDAEDGLRALREVLIDLRYLPFLWVVAAAVASEGGQAGQCQQYDAEDTPIPTHGLRSAGRYAGQRQWDAKPVAGRGIHSGSGGFRAPCRSRCGR